MGHTDPQGTLFYQVSLGRFVPQDTPCAPFGRSVRMRRSAAGAGTWYSYSPLGRPSIPSEPALRTKRGGRAPDRGNRALDFRGRSGERDGSVRDGSRLAVLVEEDLGERRLPPGTPSMQ